MKRKSQEDLKTEEETERKQEVKTDRETEMLTENLRDKDPRGLKEPMLREMRIRTARRGQRRNLRSMAPETEILKRD